MTLENEKEILTRLCSMTGLDHVLDFLLLEIDREFKFDGFLLNLFDEKQKALFCHKLRLPERLRELEHAYSGYKFDLNANELNAECFKSQKIICADKTGIRQYITKSKERLYRWDMETITAIPIQNNKTIIGTLLCFLMNSAVDPEILPMIQSKIQLFAGSIQRTLVYRNKEKKFNFVKSFQEKADSLIEFICNTNRLFSIESIFEIILNELIRLFKFNSGLIWISKDDRLILKIGIASNKAHGDTVNNFKKFFQNTFINLNPPDSVLGAVFLKNEHLFVPDAMKIMDMPLFEKDKKTLQLLKTPRTTLHIPIQYENNPIGIVTLGSLEEVLDVSQADIRIIKSLCVIIGTTIKNSELYTLVEQQKKEIQEFNLHLEDKVKEQTKEIQHHLDEKTALLQACNRFVPHEFLELLGRKSIKEITFGDNVQKDLSVLFTDIRGFTLLSESMIPEANFKFLNSYLSAMGPVLRKHKGFIDKFIGDAIMALFYNADQAVQAGMEMLENLKYFNINQKEKGFPEIRIGIGINTGELMLGTIGENNRMETTVISDAVNLASRIEGLTKTYNTPFLISEYTYKELKHTKHFSINFIDRVAVRGRKEPVGIYEVCAGFNSLTSTAAMP
ncbi:adenylate/guanylate cyclase domain-containing protein [Desulfobacterales bacterium HSG17]|nr:adenylate/guanylate cyclase domain-containing protein [Desulfobacterales bacterium HSG17]